MSSRSEKKFGEMNMDQRQENELNAATLTKRTYEKNEIKYSIYEGNDQFYGTPVPEGYEAVYIDDGIFPSSLQLKKKTLEK